MMYPNGIYNRLIGLMKFIEPSGENPYNTDRIYSITNSSYVGVLGMFMNQNLITNVKRDDEYQGNGHRYTFQLTEPFMVLHEFEKL